MNIAIIKGNLTRDPDLNYLPSGDAVLNFSVAHNYVYFNKDDEKKEKVSFFECVCFGKRAEIIAEYFLKGDPIQVTGRLETQSWDDKETDKKRSKVVVNVQQFDFVGDVSGGKEKGRGRDKDRDRDDDRRGKGKGKRKSDDGERESRKADREEDLEVPF